MEHEEITLDASLAPIDSALALKALDAEGRVGGYLVVWGSKATKDLQGEYFTPDTDLALDWYSRRPMLYHHGLDKTIKAEVVGIIDTMRKDDIGLWAEGQLNLRNRYVQAVQKLVDQGVIGWSSGSLPHLVEVAHDGQIKRWPIVEGSLTPSPAEPRRTNVNTIKSAFDELELDLTKLGDEQPEEVTPRIEAKTDAIALEEPEAREAPANEPADSDTATKTEDDPQKIPLLEREITDMKVKELVRLIVDSVASEMGATLTDEQRASVMKAIEAKDVALAADADATEENVNAAKSVAFIGDVAGIIRAAVGQVNGVQDAIKSAFANPQPVSQVQGGFSPAPASPSITLRTKYHDMTAQEMSYLHFIRNGRRDRKWQGEEPFYREMLAKAQTSYEKGDLKFDDDEQKSLKSVMGIKANELNNSVLAAGGDEWVPDLWSADLWERMRLDNVVAPRLGVVEMPSNPFELPIESTDPTVYFVPETTAETQLVLATSAAPIPDSKMATGKVQISASKLALRVGFSAEVEEDSIIPFIPQLRKQSMRAVLDALDNVLLNGDTATTLNINSDGETISATDRKYLAFNGILKLPIVTASTYKVDAGGASPTLSHMRATRAKLLNAYATDLSNLMWIVDFSTYMKLLAIDEVNTAANRGATPTSATGILGGIDGVDIFVSNEMALADSDGKVTQTANVVERGRALLVYRPAWYVGYRRRISTALDYLSYYDAYQLTMTVRVGLINRDATCTSILYNIGV